MSEPRTEAGRRLLATVHSSVWEADERAAILAIEAEARAEGLDDDERTSIYDSAWLQGYEKARAEGLDVERLREAARRVPLPDNVTVAHIEDLAREYSHVD